MDSQTPTTPDGPKRFTGGVSSGKSAPDAPLDAAIVPSTQPLQPRVVKRVVGQQVGSLCANRNNLPYN